MPRTTISSTPAGRSLPPFLADNICSGRTSNRVTVRLSLLNPGFEMATASNIIVSIKPEHARNIIAGRKTVELRRRFAGTSAIGQWMLIYSSSPEKAIIGAARIENVRRMMVESLWDTFKDELCIPRTTFLNYLTGVTEGVGVMLGPVTGFSMAIPESELRERFSFRPPQSYRYVRGQLSQILDDDRVQIPDRYEHCDWSRRPSPSRRQTQ